MNDRSEPNVDENFLFPSDDDASLQALGHFLTDNSRSTPFAAEQVTSDTQSADLRYDIGQMRGESVQQRVAKVQAAPLPLLEAVQPLLRALSEMPEKIEHRDQALLLKESLKQEITLFSVVCDEVDISWKKMAIVRYCICTALDEAAHARPWGVETGWSQSNLLNHFEGDNDGGNKFFLLVGRLSMTPHDYTDVLEIQLRILGLGFEGRYSIIENGERQLTKIRQRLLALLQSTRERTSGALSTHALPSRSIIRRWRLFIPVRVSLLLVGVLSASTFITCKYLLMVPQSALIDQMRALTRIPNAPLPAIPAKRLRLAVLLKPEIDKQLVSVDESAGHSLVTFRGDAMFMVGAVSVRAEMLPVIKRVADEIHRVKGKIRIVGHTDATPIRKPGLPNNHVLSEKRAANVSRLLQEAGIAPQDIEVAGLGETQPVASNQTSEGRAKNRRVDLFVNY